uniref:Uncharacterized protein n=1 Tax=viral metagenome TaxID=1070528 RepID=A0A6M3X4Y0_9ZZZZ
MLTKEELAEFLAMLLAFALRNEFSAAMCSKVLGVSHQSTARWISMARGLQNGTEPSATVYRYLAEPAIKKLTTLNELDAERGLFTAIKREKPAKKVEILSGALDGRTV